MNIFIDTQDMEERYGEELYKEYLEKENQQLKDKIEAGINYIDQVIMYKPVAKEIDEELNTLIGILRGE